MNFRIPLVLLLTVSVIGCISRSTGFSPPALPSPSAKTSVNQSVVPSAQGDSTMRLARRFGTAPDHGGVAAYPAQRVIRRDGAYTFHRVDLSESHAFAAIGGVLTLPLPSGGQLHYRYDRHTVHPDGNWTWVGTSLEDPNREAIITFGDQAAFGSFGQPGKEPLRLTIENGSSWLVETDPKAIGAIHNLATRPRAPDFFVAPEIADAVARRPVRDGTLVAGADGVSTASATTSSGPTVDVLVGYTPGFATGLGGDSQAVTRINFLVDVTNEAYVNSQVAAKVRLVRAISVNYADTTSNGSALEQLTGFKAPSTQTTPSPAFSALRAARDQYGADLVTLVRKFNDPENEGCGIAWLIGGGRSGIDNSDEFFGYSVVSDGRDVGSDGKTYFCRDETFAHELGHNMGSNHDRGQADGDDNVLQDNEYGEFTYSFGYTTNSANGNFYTIMAYGDQGQTRYREFSNPRVTHCGGLPCGVAEMADNARSLNNTVGTIATFRATVVPASPAPPAPSPSLRQAPYDVNGDGRSDVFLRGDTALAYWAMNGTTRTFDSYLGTGGTGWRVVAFGNFDGAAGADVLWANGSQMKIWFNLGGGSYVVYQMGSYGNGFQPFAAADVNGDGKSDILLRAGTSIAYWLLDGARVTSTAYAGDGGTGFRVVATGDFTGDGADEIVWASTTQIKMWLNGRSAGYSPVIVGTYGNGYAPFAAGYVDSDSSLDLLFRGGTAMAYWKLNGSTLVSSAYLGDGGAGYGAFAIGDYNGDGKSDIGWQNGGTIKFWMNNGAGVYSPAIVGNYNCCYVPIGNF